MNKKEIPDYVLSRIEKINNKTWYSWYQNNDEIYIFYIDDKNNKYLIDLEQEILLSESIEFIDPRIVKKDNFYIIGSYKESKTEKAYRSNIAEDWEYDIITIEKGYEKTFFVSFEGKIIKEYDKYLFDNFSQDYPKNLYIAPACDGIRYSLYNTNGEELIKNRNFTKIEKFISAEIPKSSTIEIYDLAGKRINELQCDRILYGSEFAYKTSLKYGYMLRRKEKVSYYSERDIPIFVNVRKEFTNIPKQTGFLIIKRNSKDNLFYDNRDDMINEYGTKYTGSKEKIYAFSFKDGYDTMYGCIDLLGNTILECKYNFDQFINVVREKNIITNEIFEKLYQIDKKEETL